MKAFLAASILLLAGAAAEAQDHPSYGPELEGFDYPNTPPDIAKTLGDYPALGRKAAEAIPGATLVPLPGLGHAPQVEDPATFDAALLKALAD